MSITATATICNRKGLHARASAKFVKLAAQFNATVHVAYNGYEVTATSIMGLMMLAAAPGATLSLRADGEDAQTAIDALCGLVAEGFGEELSET